MESDTSTTNDAPSELQTFEDLVSGIDHKGENVHTQWHESSGPMLLLSPGGCEILVRGMQIHWLDCAHGDPETSYPCSTGRSRRNWARRDRIGQNGRLCYSSLAIPIENPTALIRSDPRTNTVSGVDPRTTILVPLLDPAPEASIGYSCCCGHRELAFQIHEVFEALGAGIGLKSTCVVGGVDMMTQAIALARKPHVVIATPGRLVDHLENTKGFNLRSVKFLILDEVSISPASAAQLSTCHTEYP